MALQTKDGASRIPIRGPVSHQPHKVWAIIHALFVSVHN